MLHRWFQGNTVRIFLILAIFLPAIASAAEKNIDTPEARQRAQAIANAALAFRQIATADYQHALSRFASQTVTAKFKDLEASAWQTFDPATGWAFFFTFSPFTMGAVEGESPLVAYYQPWADVFLITQWISAPTGPQIVDVELCLGDMLRTSGKDDFNISPLWMRLEGYRPAAFITALVSSLTAFESRFPPDYKGNWRSQFPLMESKDAAELNRLYAGNLLLRHLQHAVAAASPALGEDERLPVIRKEIESMHAAAGSGYVKRWFSSVPDMSEEALDALEHIDGQRLARTIIASTVMTPGRALVFLVPRDRAGFTLVLLFYGNGKKLRLQRADLISYQAAYQAIVQAHAPKGGEK
jgi:hypothetical protein